MDCIGNASARARASGGRSRTLRLAPGGNGWLGNDWLAPAGNGLLGNDWLASPGRGTLENERLGVGCGLLWPQPARRAAKNGLLGMGWLIPARDDGGPGGTPSATRSASIISGALWNLSFDEAPFRTREPRVERRRQGCLSSRSALARRFTHAGADGEEHGEDVSVGRMPLVMEIRDADEHREGDVRERVEIALGPDELRLPGDLLARHVVRRAERVRRGLRARAALLHDLGDAEVEDLPARRAIVAPR